jgi:thiamine monophosphate synthase
MDGVHLVQVRERDLDGGPLTRLVTACVDAVRGTRARVLVNDSIRCGARGGCAWRPSTRRFISCVEDSRVRASRFSDRPIRAFGIGRRARGQRADAVDYLIFGTVFASGSKPDRPAAGLRELTAVASATRLPVLAIGGMTMGRIADVMRAGAGRCGRHQHV